METAALANERGLGAVTITTLSEYLGIKKPSLYNHVKSQEDIYKGIMIHGWTNGAGAITEHNKYESEELLQATERIYHFFFVQTDKLKIDRSVADHLLRTYRAFLEGFSLLVIHHSFGNPISIEESFEISLNVLLKGIEPYERRERNRDL